jgi:Domain of unknown function (DUF6438)
MMAPFLQSQVNTTHHPMKHLLWISLVLVSLLGLSACKTGKGAQSKKAKVQSDFLLEIQHTGCRGMCPVFSYTVKADGSASYVGKRAVEREGNWTKTLPASTLSDMLEAINAADFWKLDPVYGGEVADLPSVVVKFTHGGQTHQVQNIRYAPESFTTLVTKLEGWIGQEGWTKAQ